MASEKDITPADIEKWAAGCKTGAELLQLKKNILSKNEADLAVIVDRHLLDRFPALASRTSVSLPFAEIRSKYNKHPSLNQAQIEFLSKYQVPQEKLFNATGMSNLAYKERMKGGNYFIAYGTVPCGSGGHTLRTRAGHCFQCNPQNISYQSRHRSEGMVYVAESIASSRIVKVGCAESAQERISGLNSEQYAGRRDWVLKFSTDVKNMGLVESSTHAALAPYAITDKSYYKEGLKTNCREIFSCPVSTAVGVLNNVISAQSNK